MKKNRASLFAIVCLFLSVTSCYASSLHPKRLTYKGATQAIDQPESQSTQLTRQPSLDFIRGDAIPLSLSLNPFRYLKIRGDLMFDQYNTEVDRKEVKIGRTHENSFEYWNRLSQYIDIFTQHVQEVNELNRKTLPTEKHAARARNIDHALWLNADRMKQVDFTLPETTRKNLEAIIYARVDNAAAEWKGKLKERISNKDEEKKLINELYSLSAEQETKARQRHKLNDCKNTLRHADYLCVNLAINRWKDNNYDEHYASIVKQELRNFSNKELDEVCAAHNIEMK